MEQLWILRGRATEQAIENSLEITSDSTTNNRDMVIRMIESGVDEKDIPYILGADKRHSIASWENQDPQVRHLFDKAREVVLNKVENSLLRMALGGTLITIKTGTSKSGENIDETTVKEIGGDFKAAAQILKLFRPDVWAALGTEEQPEQAKTTAQIADAEEARMKKLGGKFLEAIQSKVVAVQSRSI